MAGKSYLTAIKRKSLSLPARLLRDNGLLRGRVLDFGCGRGFDCDSLGIEGWDPYWRPKMPRGKFDTVMCNYVLNVLDLWEQRQVLDRIKFLLRKGGHGYAAVRTDWKNLRGWTSKGTYQREVLMLDWYIEYEGKGFRIYDIW